MNQVTLTGRIGNDIELKSTTNGKTFVRFSLAVDGGKKDNVRVTHWIPCIAWNKTAEFISSYFHKGDGIEVNGELISGSYENDGKKFQTLDVRANQVYFPIAKKTEGSGKPTEADEIVFEPINPEDEELPF